VPERYPFEQVNCVRGRRDDHAAKTILRDKANVILNSQLRVNGC
jgi:hypothetical protein